MSDIVKPVTKLVYEMPQLGYREYWKVSTKWVHEVGFHKILVELWERSMFREDQLLECGEIEASTDPSVNSARAVRLARKILERYQLRTNPPKYDNLEGCILV